MLTLTANDLDKQVTDDRADLCATVIALTPCAPATIVANQGRALHALFLRLIAEADPALAAQLHDDSQVKPFTCSNLWRPRDRTQQADGADALLHCTPGETWYIRYTTLTAALTATWLTRALAALPAEVELSGATFRPLEVLHEGHPAAGRSSYAALTAAFLVGTEPPPTRWQFAFLTPTSFRSGGMTVPFPLPELLFGSLLDRWNAWSPVTLPPETRRFAKECIAVSRYRLRTKALAGRGERIHRGAVGRCTYAALNRDRYWCSAISTLSAFAFYSGAGYQTTQGMGVCKWLSR